MASTHPTITQPDNPREPRRVQCWTDDGVNGSPSSMTILLRWLSVPGNYMRWRATSPISGNRLSRADICQEIVVILEDNHLHHRNDWRRVGHRILELEKSYRTAAYFMECTRGRGHDRLGGVTDQIVLREPTGSAQRREAFNQANREAITEGSEDGSDSEATNSN
ncbi:hypothetical protein PtB15_5B681 [Puccinia triticina]|nr:hypothetical protein PtB15_5B681 [Puccinia triticina]